MNPVGANQNAQNNLQATRAEPVGGLGRFFNAISCSSCRNSTMAVDPKASDLRSPPSNSIGAVGGVTEETIIGMEIEIPEGYVMGSNVLDEQLEV